MSQTASAWVAPETSDSVRSRHRAIARSVLYASLFDYPLSLAQVRQTLIESVQTPTDILAAYEESEALRAIVEFRDGWFFPRGRYDLVAERRRREARSRVFLGRHRRLLRLICAMPYVRMVALSGSIAHANLDGHGDLDLFIVTRGRHVWSVAVAVVLLAKLMRRRRTVCANFVVADSALAIDPPDLFSASQIIHLKPLVGEATYRRLLDVNPFVAYFYPNFHATRRQILSVRQGVALRGLKAAAEALAAWPSSLVEVACRRAYGRYLRRRASTWQSPEQVRLEPDCLKLHTRSHRRSVLTRFEHATSEWEAAEAKDH